MSNTGNWFLIHYCHDDCPVTPGITWDDQWLAACDSPCPACGRDIEALGWEETEKPEQRDCLVCKQLTKLECDCGFAVCEDCQHRHDLIFHPSPGPEANRN